MKHRTRRKISKALKAWWSSPENQRRAKLDRLRAKAELEADVLGDLFCDIHTPAVLAAQIERQATLKWCRDHDESDDWEFRDGIPVRVRYYGKPILPQRPKPSTIPPDLDPGTALRGEPLFPSKENSHVQNPHHRRPGRPARRTSGSPVLGR